MGDRVALGLDFGTESVRAVLLDLTGRERGVAVASYEHGQIVRTLPGSNKPLPPHFALQDPHDWLDAAGVAVRGALQNDGVTPDSVIGIGVDFTSCTMLPCLADGTPLCKVERWRDEPYAWPKLWKHHGAQVQADRITRVAAERGEPWLARYGGSIGLEWFFPKILETLEHAPQAYEHAGVWIEGGDWLVWRLVGGEAAALPRSTCQAGYKALWNSRTGYPSAEYFAAVNPAMAGVLDKVPGKLLAPGQSAGVLTPAMAKRLGLAPGVSVSAATIDAHAAVPGAGVSEPGVMVMVLGTSSCHMLNATVDRPVPGVAGVVEGGILPGYFGYETGQAAVGDAFDWLRTVLGHDDFDALTEQAATIAPGADGVLCVDWFNGCRTPLMDGRLRGAFTGLAIHHGPGHLYRAVLEASACGVRWIIELLEAGGVPVNALVATGGLPHHNPLLPQVYADVIGKPITVHPAKQAPALGAAILGALAAGPNVTGLGDTHDAIATLSAPAAQGARQLQPNPQAAAVYDQVYARYRHAADWLA